MVKLVVRMASSEANARVIGANLSTATVNSSSEPAFVRKTTVITGVT